MTPEEFAAVAAEAFADALDGMTVDLTTEASRHDLWDLDADDSDGDELPPGQLYLSHDDGRSVLVQLTVTVVEGALT